MSPAERAVQALRQQFACEPAALAWAPGRVNLIGEHTDYNGGFVLPCAIGFGTAVAIAPRAGREVHTLAVDHGGALDVCALDAPIARSDERPWATYVRGMLRELLADDGALPGAALAVAGDVPQGAGLSSSASFLVALGQAFAQLRGDTPAPAHLARLAQQAENRFVGVDCGIMDPLASAAGVAGHALLIDCRSLAVQPVRVPDGVAVVIADSRVQRGLVGSQYNLRRRQCEAAAAHFGVATLRDLDLDTLQARGVGLSPECLRRARHVVTENARTLEAAQALAAGDLARLGALMAASHASMRDDFEITLPPLDRLAALMHEACGGDGGARMTGGGFGGCVVAVLPAARVPALRDAVARHYRAPDGQMARVWVTAPAAGAMALRLPAPPAAAP